MKKILLFIISLLLFIPLYVNAEDKYLVLDDYHVDLIWNKDDNNFEVKETYIFNNDYEDIHLDLLPDSISYETNFVDDDSDIRLNKLEKGEYYISFVTNNNCFSMTRMIASYGSYEVLYTDATFTAMEKNEKDISKNFYLKDGIFFDTKMEPTYFEGKLKERVIGTPKLEICAKLTDYYDSKYKSTFNIAAFDITGYIIKTIISIIVGIAVIIINKCIINKANDKIIKKNTLMMCLLVFLPMLVACISTATIPRILNAPYYYTIYMGMAIAIWYILLFRNSEMHDTGRQPLVMFVLFFFSGCYLYPIMYILLMISLTDVLDYHFGDMGMDEVVIENPIIDDKHINKVKKLLKKYDRLFVIEFVMIICLFDYGIILFTKDIYIKNNMYLIYYIIPVISSLIIYIVKGYKTHIIINRLKTGQIKKTIDIGTYYFVKHVGIVENFYIIKAKIGKKIYKSYPYYGDTENLSVRLLIYDDKRKKYILDVYEKDVTN